MAGQHPDKSVRLTGIAVAGTAPDRYFRHVRGKTAGNSRIHGERIMSLRLSDDDRRAIDMLLDEGISPTTSTNGHSGGHAGFASTTVDAMRARLNKAGDLLAMLNHLPSTEPPSDLVARTLRMIEQSGRGETDATVLPPSLDVLGMDQTMA
jgi:hypothetical protein